MNNLIDERAIERVLKEYCFLLDSWQDDRLIPEVFDPEGTGDCGFGEMNVLELVNCIKAIHQDFESTGHFLSNIAVDVEGDSATSKAYVTAWHWRKATSHLGAVRPTDFVALCIYDDRFKRTTQGWRIVRRVVRPVGGMLGPGSAPENIGSGGVRF